MEEISLQTRGHAADTDKRRNADQANLSKGCIDQQHGRAERESIGHNKGADGKLCGDQGGFHGIGLGNCRAGIGSQRHRRRQVGHDTEVKHEEVGRDNGHAHTDQDRGAGSGHNAVGRGGGHAHTQNDAADHGQEQSDKGAVACQDNDAVNNHVGKAGHGDGSGNDTRYTAGSRNGDGSLSAGSKRLQQSHGGDPGLPAEQRHKNAGHNGQSRRVLNAPLAGSHQVDEQQQGQQQVGLFQQGFNLR